MHADTDGTCRRANWNSQTENRLPQGLGFSKVEKSEWSDLFSTATWSLRSTQCFGMWTLSFLHCYAHFKATRIYFDIDLSTNLHPTSALHADEETAVCVCVLHGHFKELQQFYFLNWFFAFFSDFFVAMHAFILIIPRIYWLRHWFLHWSQPSLLFANRS